MYTIKLKKALKSVVVVLSVLLLSNLLLVLNRELWQFVAWLGGLL